MPQVILAKVQSDLRQCLHDEHMQTQVVQRFGAESTYRADAERSGSSSPFVCALATTSGDTDVMKFCCEPEPVIANILELP